MRNSALQLIFDLLVLAVGLALEELTPKFGGIGLPLMLTAVAVQAGRRSLVSAVLLALAAGGIEDALSALPVMLSASYFLGAALWARCRELPVATWLLMYPGYQLWLGIWISDIGGGIFNRLLVSLALAVVTVPAVAALLGYCERKAGVDEAE